IPLENEFERGKNHMFKIGDVWLNIPPTHITISQMRTSYTIPLLGFEAKPLATPVNRTIIKVNVVFTGEQVFDDLVRITTQFKYCSINMLRSHDLFNRVAEPGSFLHRDYSISKYIPVTMDNYTLYTVDGHPGTIACVMQFSLFNYSTYLEMAPLQYYKHDPNFETLIKTLAKDAAALDEKASAQISKEQRR